MPDPKAEIDLVLDTHQFNRAVRGAKQAVGGIGDRFKAAGATVKGAFAGMATSAKAAIGAITSGMAAAGTAVTALLGPIGIAIAAVAGLVLAIKEFVTGAVEAEQAMHELRGEIEMTGNDGTYWLKQLAAEAKALGKEVAMSDEQIKKLQGTALRMGIQIEDVTEAVEQALNLAARTGKPAQDALKAITELAAGSADAFQEMMPSLKRYTDQTQKMAAAHKFLAESEGAAATALSDTSRAWAEIGNAFHDIKESLGKLLLPVVQELSYQLRDMLEVVAALLDMVGGAGTIKMLVKGASYANPLTWIAKGVNWARGGGGQQNPTEGYKPVGLTAESLMSAPVPRAVPAGVNPFIAEQTQTQQLQVQRGMLDTLKQIAGIGGLVSRFM